MEVEMKIDPVRVRELTESRNWSQEQLAAAAGVSVRTVQRAEAVGTASRETRVCLAAALDTQVSDLLVDDQSTAGEPANFRANAVVTAWVHMLVGVTMLAAGFLSKAPSVVLWIGLFFLSFGLAFKLLARFRKRAPSALWR